MKSYFKNEFAEVYYNEELETLFLVYLKKVPDDAMFILINTAVLDNFLKLTSYKFVADVRKMGIIGIKSQQWVVETLFPGMIKHLKGKKLIHAQIIDPKEVMSKVAAGNIKNKADQTNANEEFSVKQFSDEAQLEEYLKMT
jgi:hypothetical protein